MSRLSCRRRDTAYRAVYPVITAHELLIRNDARLNTKGLTNHRCTKGVPDRRCLDSGFAAADWAELPLSPVQQILCTDTDSFVRGAQVCKAWKQTCLMKGVGSSNAELISDDFLETSLKDPDQALVEELHKHASHPLEHLTIIFCNMFESDDAVSRFSSVFGVQPHANIFPLLVKLDMQGGCLSNWEFVKDLPHTLQSLSLPVCLNQHSPSLPAQGSSQPTSHRLDCFNALHSLRQLCVFFETIILAFVEDLDLPYLHTLQLEMKFLVYRPKHSPVVLQQFSAAKIPVTCIVTACELIGFTSHCALRRTWALPKKCS